MSYILIKKKKLCICRYAQKLQRERLRNNQIISKDTWLKKKKKILVPFFFFYVLSHVFLFAE